jgi:hypothetical protein
MGTFLMLCKTMLTSLIGICVSACFKKWKCNYCEWEVPKGSYNTYWKVEKCEHLCNYPMSSLFLEDWKVMESQLNGHKYGELCKLKTLFVFLGSIYKVYFHIYWIHECYLSQWLTISSLTSLDNIEEPHILICI